MWYGCGVCRIHLGNKWHDRRWTSRLEETGHLETASASLTPDAGAVSFCGRDQANSSAQSGRRRKLLAALMSLAQEPQTNERGRLLRPPLGAHLREEDSVRRD